MIADRPAAPDDPASSPLPVSAVAAEEDPAPPPLVALVGRPNVGKSQLFNRLTRTRRALVEPLAGTTRDRQYGYFDWRGRRVRVVDTGGVEGPDADPFAEPIRQQVLRALEEAAVIVFVVDAAGAAGADHEIAGLLRRTARPVLLVANKADRSEARHNLPELFALGLGEPMPISAYHGQGVADLMDRLLAALPESAPRPQPPGEIPPLRLALVGRPNVGKSSLLNAILGEERTIVSPVAGTTRDAIDTPFTFEGRAMTLVDTAGIRRRGKVRPGVERHSVAQAERAVDRADVVVLVIDQTEPTAAQDTHIAGYVADQGKGLVLVVNKWDLAEPGTDRHRFAGQVDARYRFVPWAPVLFTSAVRGTGVRELLEMAMHVEEVRRRRVPTAELNRVLQRAFADHHPRSVHGRRLKLLYATQAAVAPPTVVLFVNDPELLHFAYRRYIENRLREAFEFEGAAIRIVLRRRSDPDAVGPRPRGERADARPAVPAATARDAAVAGEDRADGDGDDWDDPDWDGDDWDGADQGGASWGAGDGDGDDGDGDDSDNADASVERGIVQGPGGAIARVIEIPER